MAELVSKMSKTTGWIDYSKLPAPQCQCKECDEAELEDTPRRFQCTQCQRQMPWCFRASDSYESLCDQCWGNVNRAEDQIGSSLNDRKSYGELFRMQNYGVSFYDQHKDEQFQEVQAESPTAALAVFLSNVDSHNVEVIDVQLVGQDDCETHKTCPNCLSEWNAVTGCGCCGLTVADVS